MREWRELHRQLKLMCDELGWAAGRRTTRTARAARRTHDLHRALIAGLPTQVGNRAQAADRKAASALRRSARAQVPAVPGFARWRKQAATLGAVGDAARHRARVGADQRRDRAGLGRSPNCRTCSRAATTIRTGRVRRGAWSAASRSACSAWCWRPSGRSTTARCIRRKRAQIFVRDALVTGEINTRSRVPRAQPRDAGQGEGRGSQAAPRRPGRRRGLAGALVLRPPAARDVHNVQALDAWYAQAVDAGKGRARMVAAPTCWSAMKPMPRAFRPTCRWATRGWRCAIASSPARSMTA